MRGVGRDRKEISLLFGEVRHVERPLAELRPGGAALSRAAVYGRYVLDETASFYLPPLQYMEVFAANQNHFLPDPRVPTPWARRGTRIVSPWGRCNSSFSARSGTFRA